jgi:hypothetical protein
MAYEQNILALNPGMERELDKRWRSLTIANDFVFCKVMLDPNLCKEVIEAFLA